MGRLMTLAKQLIDDIPEEGATIVVVRNDIACWLKKGVRERRGFHLSKRCKFVTVYHMKDCDKLVGITGHVMLDHSFLESAKPDVQERVVALVWAAEVMMPNAPDRSVEPILTRS